MAVSLSVLLAIILIVIGIPFWIGLGIATTSLLYFTGALPMQLIGEALFEGVDSFALIAIPLFVLTGDIMVRSGLAYRLLDFAEASFGSFRSGFGTATIMGCGLFACISGSDAADAAAIGRITMKRLEEKGYPRDYACALVASGACTGILIPPSIAYIIIGLVLGISSSTLFQAAFVPGVMILGAVMITNAIMNRIRGYEHSTGRFSLKRWLSALNRAKWALLIPFIILGGIYSGIFTPTESAAVAAFTALVIGMIQGNIVIAQFPAMLGASARVCGVVLPIIAVALLFAQALTLVDVPQQFVAWVLSFTDSIPFVSQKTAVILLMLIIWIIAGCFMETGPNIVVLGPLMLPLAKQIGMDPIQFCIFMITTLGLGFITPPFGLNLFVMSGLTRTPVTAIAGHALPFVVAMIIVSIIIGFVPAISLFTL
jgi:tripartite ATP-independent transporter DctM subunit